MRFVFRQERRRGAAWQFPTAQEQAALHARGDVNCGTRERFGRVSACIVATASRTVPRGGGTRFPTQRS